MRDCGEYTELAELFSDGLLTDEENEKLKSHLECCPDCRRRVEAAGAMSAAFSSMEAEPPDTLAPGIKYKLSLEPSERKPLRRFLPGSLTVAAACIALLIILSQRNDAGSPALIKGLPDQGTALGGEAEFSDSLMMASPEAGQVPQPTSEDTLERAYTTAADSAAGESNADDYTDTKNSQENEAPAAAPQASAAPDGYGGLTDESFDVMDAGGSIPIPDGVEVMGITLMSGDIPEELEEFEVIEENDYLYVLMPAEEYKTFSAMNGGRLVDDSELIEPEAERGVVVFSK